MASNTHLRIAYDECLAIAGAHYENFPVASHLVPRDKRLPLAAVYAFARTADDFADEGIRTPKERLELLDAWGDQLSRALAGTPTGSIFVALADTTERFAIPPQLYRDLLTAFRWDVTRTHYATFKDLLDYCRCSANPVGRIVLNLFGPHPTEHDEWSDAICTALQLTNFWQDVEIDLKKGRFYLPLEDLERFGYTEKDLVEQVEDQRFRSLLKFQVSRTCEYFARGRELIQHAPRGLRLQLAVTWNGGSSILNKIEHCNYGVLSSRPRLRWYDAIGLLLSSMTMVR